MKNFAIIGFGGLGKTHFLNLLRHEKERGDICLKAICNDTLETIKNDITINITTATISDIDFSRFNLYTDYKEMVEKENLDFVIVALPTFLHSEVSIYLLNHGIDVLIEKPMAASLLECREMIAAAEKNGRKLMVGHSLRFSQEYKFLKETVINKTYGNPIKAEFARKSPLPSWSFGNWMLDETKSGGCIIDMHVHDVDMMQWLFGSPEEINVAASNNMAPFECTYSIYKYPNFIASIITDWGIQGSFSFTSSFAITFENAYIESVNGNLKIYTNNEVIDGNLIENNELYEEEKEFIEAVVDGKPFKTADVYSVYETMKIVFKEKEIAKNLR